VAPSSRGWTKTKAGYQDFRQRPHPPATVNAIKKEEPTEERAFNTYLEARRSVLFEEFVAKRQEEYEKRRQTTMKSNAEVRQHPIVIESDDDNAELTTDDGPQEAMEVTTTATSRNAGPSHLSSRNKDDIGYISPLALAKPEEVLPMKQRLQLAEERLAGKNVAVKTQALQLETAERRQVALQQELATAKNDLQLLKMEADMALARERQAVVKLQAENLTLQQQMTALNQQALDHAQLTRAHQLLQAQFEALRAENEKLEARIVRIKKKKDEPVVPWPLNDELC
jgi:hypothetical protein